MVDFRRPGHKYHMPNIKVCTYFDVRITTGTVILKQIYCRQNLMAQNIERFVWTRNAFTWERWMLYAHWFRQQVNCCGQVESEMKLYQFRYF